MNFYPQPSFAFSLLNIIRIKYKIKRITHKGSNTINNTYFRSDKKLKKKPPDMRDNTMTATREMIKPVNVIIIHLLSGKFISL